MQDRMRGTYADLLSMCVDKNGMWFFFWKFGFHWYGLYAW